MNRSDLSNVTFRKSSHSGGADGGGGECVEVALQAECTLIRDSKNSTGPVLAISLRGWQMFRDGLR